MNQAIAIPRTDSAHLALRIIVAAAALGLAIVLARLEVEPVATWFYLFAWYPTLLLLDTFVVVVGGRSMLERPKNLLIMLWWSAVIWFLFEALNFRLQNWYYIFVPSNNIARWGSTILAFATVVPAIVLAERLLDRLKLGHKLMTRRIVVRPKDLKLAAGIGWGLLALVMVFPRLLFPLVWAAVWLIAEPALYRSDPEHSLFRDMELGRWGRIARVMLGGLFIGLLWESFNHPARAKWIYTVPFLEGLKIFEMPPYGFLGFPPFALEAWTLYHLLARKARWKTAVASVAFVSAVFVGMELWTYSSKTPLLVDLPRTAPEVQEQLRKAGLDDVFRIARTEPDALQLRAGLSRSDAESVHEAAKLVTLSGIGTFHAAALVHGGIETVHDLGQAHPDDVFGLVGGGARGGARPTAAEVRVWVRAAREQVGVFIGEEGTNDD